MLNLGVVIAGGEVRNHRSLLKILANPFLRLVGLQVVSMSDGKDVFEYRMLKCRQQKNLLHNLKESWFYEMPDGAVVRKVRRLW